MQKEAGLAAEGGTGTKHQRETDRPEGQAAETEVEQVLHQDVGGVLRHVHRRHSRTGVLQDVGDRLVRDEVHGLGDIGGQVEVGVDIPAEELRADHDAVVLAMGSRVERDVDITGRNLDGVHFAMEYLYQRNRAVALLANALRDRFTRSFLAATDRSLAMPHLRCAGGECFDDGVHKGRPRTGQTRDHHQLIAWQCQVDVL